MNCIVVLALLLPAVFSRVAFELKSSSLQKGITIEDVKELQDLNALTKKLQESGERFKNPLQSSLKVSDQDVSFYLSNRKNPEEQKILLGEAQKITNVSSFNTNLETIFIIHGWHNNINSTFDSSVSQVYLGIIDVNVVRVDWDELASKNYLTAFSSVPAIGKLVGEFIKNISTAYDYSLDHISLVGHSLGAHVSGYAGQETKGALSSITGLDPAGPLYFKGLLNERLSEDDAQYVQSIHTDAGLLGVNYNVAHADYWPNNGHFQPGCGLSIPNSCSHSRSYILLVESFLSKDFIAKPCKSYNVYKAGQCKNATAVIMGGAYVNTTIFGTFYLQTNSSSPYALGETDL